MSLIDTTENMATSVAECTGYCNLLSYKKEMEDMFAEQVAAAAASIAELSMMANPLTLVGYLVAKSGAALVIAQAQQAIMLANQASIMAQIADKLEELKDTLPEGADPNTYCDEG